MWGKASAVDLTLHDMAGCSCFSSVLLVVVRVAFSRQCGWGRCWEMLHGKTKKIYAHGMIYPWRCIATRGRVCLRTLVDRKRKRLVTRLMYLIFFAIQPIEYRTYGTSAFSTRSAR